MSDNGRASLLSRGALADYRPRVHGAGLPWRDHRGPTLFDLEKMRHDPRVRLGLRVIKAPISTVKWQVSASSQDVADWVDRTLKKVWAEHLSRLLLAVDYGSVAAESAWAPSEETGLLELADLRYAHPSDVRPLELAGQPCGFRVRSLPGDGRVLPPRSLHLVLEPEWSPYYGRSRVLGAWEPWSEKSERHGAREVRRTWYLKNATRGGVMRHPLGMVDLGDGVSRSCQGYAAEIMERWESNGILVLPNAFDSESGKFLWDYEHPQAMSDIKGVSDYVKDLDQEIFEGMEIPVEVIQAAESGGSWAGRTVPFVVFLTAEDAIAAAVLRCLERDVLKPGVDANFGEGARFRVEAKSLVPPDEEKEAKGQEGQGGLSGALGGQGQQDRERLSTARLSGDWVRYQGERGGHGWRNTRTGEVVYGDLEPGQRGTGEDTEGKLSRLLQGAQALPAAVKSRATQFISARYEKLAARYGPTGAKVVLAGVVALTPVPLPGTSLLPIALAEGVRALGGLFRRTPEAQPVQMSAGVSGASGAPPDPAELAQAAKDLLAEFYAHMGEEMPPVDGGGLLEAIGQALAESDADRLSVVRLALDDWRPYLGKRGANKGKQVGWQNAGGRVVYGAERPGSKAAAAAAAREQARAAKPTVASVTAQAKELLADRKKLTPESVLGLIDGLLSLKLAEMRQVRQALGGESGGKSKSELAKKVATKVHEALSGEPAKPAEKPAPPPEKKEGQAPKRRKPEPEPQDQPQPPQATAGAGSHAKAADLLNAHPVVAVGDLRGLLPGLSEEQLAAGLGRLADAGKIQIYQDVQPELLAQKGGVLVDGAPITSVSRRGTLTAGDIAGAFGGQAAAPAPQQPATPATKLQRIRARGMADPKADNSAEAAAAVAELKNATPDELKQVAQDLGITKRARSKAELLRSIELHLTEPHRAFKSFEV